MDIMEEKLDIKKYLFSPKNLTSIQRKKTFKNL